MGFMWIVSKVEKSGEIVSVEFPFEKSREARELLKAWKKDDVLDAYMACV